MKLITGLAMAVAALALCAGHASVAAETISFQPEVLLMRTASKGAEKSFSYAKLKLATATGQPPTVVFRYRADADTATVTIKAKPAGSNGVVAATITIQRKRTLPDGNEDITTTTNTFGFTPGKSLIVDYRPQVMANAIDGTVEILQLTLQK